jgi:hypothetical protein
MASDAIGFFDWLRHLFATKREPYQSSSELFLELDLRAVRAELKPLERGRENGLRDVPPSDVTVFDSVERDMVAFFAGQQKRAHDMCEQQLQVFDERIRNLAVTFLHSDIAGRVHAASADLRALGQRGRNELFDLQRRVTSLASELMEFRAAHHLRRDAEFPESRTWHFAILGGLLLIETVLNGLMLAQGTAGGRLEGFTQALVLSALNLSIGFLMGRIALPLARHRRLVTRLLGGLIMIVAITASITFNLLVGHYRDALGGPSPETAPHDAGVAFAAHPFQLADLNSWALCGLGLLFAAVAAYDTFRMDDPYWGYGRRWRRNEQMHADFIAERQYLMTEAAEFRDEALDAIGRAEEDTVRAGQHTETLRRQQRAVLDKFSAYQDYLERTGALLLGEYRGANERTRKSKTPVHFSEDWQLPRVAAAIGVEAVDFTRFAQNLDQYRADVIVAYDAAITAIKTIEDLVADGETQQVHA